MPYNLSLYRTLTIVLTFFLFSFNWRWIPELSKDSTKKYVFIVVIDGPRYSETFGDLSCKNVPHLGGNLKKEGAFFSNFWNNGPTYTNAGHTAITTGDYQSISNNGKELPKQPSIFQYFLKTSGTEKENAMIISSKGKLEILGNTKDKHWKNTYLPTTYCGPNGNSAGYELDVNTFAKIKEVITTKPPQLLLINLLEVDVMGHENNWTGYLKGIRNTDSLTNELWTMVQTSEILKDNTYLFITNDHGRHLDGKKDGFVSHGDGCEGCRKISLLVLGPGIKKGSVIEKKREQLDISKTVAHLLGFEIPTSKGALLSEMFE